MKGVIGNAGDGDDGTSEMGFERDCRSHVPLAKRPTERNYHQPRMATKIFEACRLMHANYLCSYTSSK